MKALTLTLTEIHETSRGSSNEVVLGFWAFNP